jgi:hypothetical protein
MKEKECMKDKVRSMVITRNLKNKKVISVDTYSSPSQLSLYLGLDISFNHCYSVTIVSKVNKISYPTLDGGPLVVLSQCHLKIRAK